MSQGRPATDDEAPALGSLVGRTVHERYVVERELGAGSLGRVYLARDKARGEAVALKVVRHDRLSAEALAFLKGEFQNLARLRHPNVARVYDLDELPPGLGGADEKGSLLFFTEELLEGPDFVQAARTRTLDQFLELLVQALRALAYVHARGLLHADMKPKNLFVVPGEDGRDRVKLVDFHLARELRGPAERSLRGTIAYMAPEVVKGEKTDARADLYSLGVVAYEALTGALPFSSANPLDVLRAHATEKVPSLRSRGVRIPPGLEAVVLRLLEKDPEARFKSANDVIRALNAALGRKDSLETAETREGYLLSPRFVGRERELERLVEAARAVRGDGAAIVARSDARRRRAVEISLDGLSGSDAGLIALTRDGASDDDGAGLEKHPADTRPARGVTPRVFAVTGEGGVGKTRLLRELRVLCQLDGLPVHEVRAHGLGGGALAPFLALVESVVKREGDATLVSRAIGPSGHVELSRILELMTPNQRAAVPPDGTSGWRSAVIRDDRDGPRGARFRAVEAVAELLLACSRDRPYVALVEDAQALDEASLELVRYLAAEGGEGQALFVLAARDDGEGTPLRGISSLPSGAELALERLSLRSTGELIASMVAAESVPEETARRVHEVTAGNPRFVEESLRALSEAQAISTSQGAGEAAPGQGADATAVRKENRLLIAPEAIVHLRAPRGVVEVAARRVERLDERSRRVLASFAVLARPRPLAFAARVASLSLEDADGALADLVRRGLIARRQGSLDPGLFEVASEPVREAALRALPEENVRELHASCARLLEARHPASGSDHDLLVDASIGPRDRAEELLHHLASAGEPGRAFAHAVEAAESARSRFEPIRAQRLYARALDLADRARDRGDSPKGAEVALVRVRLGECRMATGDRKGAALAFAAAAHDARASAATVALARRFEAGLKKSLGAYDRAERALEKAARSAVVATREGDQEGARELARIEAERASVRLWRGDYAGALKEGTRALESLRTLGVEEELGPVLQVLYHAAHFSGEDERARGFLAEALRARPDRDPRGRADADAPGARAALAALEEPRSSNALGDGGGAHVPLSSLGAAFDRTGRAQDLVAVYERKVELLEAVRDGEGAALAHNNLANLRRLAGRYDLAIRGYRRALQLHRSLGGRPGVAVARLNLARALAELGDPSGAEARAVRARAAARACGARWIEAQAELAIADAQRRRGEIGPARDALARARDVVGGIGNVPLRAEVELASAEVELDAEDLVAAGTALNAFFAVPPSAASAPSVARARILLARHRLASAKTAAADARATLLAEARDAATVALDAARTLRAPELEWRAARVRADAELALGAKALALEDVVFAMETLRRVARTLPRDLRALYLGDPERLEVKEAFHALGR